MIHSGDGTWVNPEGNPFGQGVSGVVLHACIYEATGMGREREREALLVTVDR